MLQLNKHDSKDINLSFCSSRSSLWSFRSRRWLDLSYKGTLPSSAAAATNTASDRCPRLVRCHTARPTLPAAMQYGRVSSLSVSARYSACLHDTTVLCSACVYMCAVCLSTHISQKLHILHIFCACCLAFCSSNDNAICLWLSLVTSS